MNRIDITEDLSFSQIAYGMWRLDEADDTSPAAIQEKIEACLTQGITTIDQADIYGLYTAEGLLGAALNGSGLRDKIELVTKCDIVVGSDAHPNARVKHYDTSPEYITAALERSLKEMAVDHVDLLLIHRPDPLMDHNATGRALDDLVASGKTRAVGVSNFRPWDFSMLQSAMENDLVVNSCKKKQLTNVRAAGSDDALLLTPPIRMSLEQAIEFIVDDEIVELTPESIRLRKRELEHSMRKRK